MARTLLMLTLAVFGTLSAVALGSFGPIGYLLTRKARQARADLRRGCARGSLQACGHDPPATRPCCWPRWPAVASSHRR
jgi:hypothetical protein